MSSHQYIRAGRKRLHMSEQQFATAVGVSRGAVQQWERPDGTAPRRSNWQRVADVLGVPVAELLLGLRTDPTPDVRAEVPLVSEVEAGNYTVIDNFSGTGHFDTVPTRVDVKRHTYALRVHGDSMVSESGDSFPQGAILIVEPEMNPQPGDYVIALNTDNETTFKQLIKDNGDLYLKPLNIRYPIKPLGSAKIIGVVREFTKRFR
ncbi:MAG: helix-turn-helix domain-containing protein [Variovorax sp.]|nr:MAG: helix-turn-helix domain-containing protein [Variovorax sp.]